MSNYCENASDSAGGGAGTGAGDGPVKKPTIVDGCYQLKAANRGIWKCLRKESIYINARSIGNE